MMRDPARKSTRWLAAAVAIAAYAAASPGLADPSELPMRKAGLWQLTTVMDEGAGPKEHVFKMCIDAAMEASTVRASMLDHEANCATYQVNVAGGVTTVDADCVFNTANVRSRTEMSGDFMQTFEVKIESTTLAKGGAQSRPVKRTIRQTGSYLGEACGNVGPGEAMAPDGSKYAVQ
jgi:hypothetical protein